jgi:hypothetical protein
MVAYESSRVGSLPFYVGKHKIEKPSGMFSALARIFNAIPLPPFSAALNSAP